MRTLFLSLIFFISTYSSFSQNNYTIVFGNAHLVIQDSVSFWYVPSENTPIPLGSGYWGKSSFHNSKEGFKIQRWGRYGKPQTYRYYKRKCKKGKWVITTEKKEVAGYTCIKATGKYNYNKYTVWFSLDLPKYFGPLMLTSLPGTILKSKNEDTGYSIEASQVIKGGLPIVDPIVAKK